MSFLDSAIEEAQLERTDDRGLMPLDQARRHLTGLTYVERDNLDRTWAALLSLHDAAEFGREVDRLTWTMPGPRGFDNIAPVERFGAELLPWLATQKKEGVFVNSPWCLVPCLVALKDPRALEVLLEVKGVEGREAAQSQDPVIEGDRLALQWTQRHPELAFPVLARHAATSPRATRLLKQLGDESPADVRARLQQAGAAELIERLELPTSITAKTILSRLDKACEGGGDFLSWPYFHMGVDGRMEYFALRLIAARAKEGDGWGVVLERIMGSDPHSLQVARFPFGPGAENCWSLDHSPEIEFSIDDDDGDDGDDGSHVFHGSVARSGEREVVLDEALLATHDLALGKNTEPGSWSMRVGAIRAFMLAHPGAFWPPPEEALPSVGLPDGEVLLVSDAFFHVVGPPRRDAEPEREWHVLPSDSETYRSLAEAIVHRDPSRFRPGTSNLHWRQHLYDESPAPMPWSQHRAGLDDGFVAAAMAETGEALDERNLLPLTKARELVAGTSVFRRGQGRKSGETWAWDSDLAWAALLSLADATEAAEAVARWKWEDAPRDAAENAALAERYGDGLFTILEKLKRADGVLENRPAFVKPSILSRASPAAFKFLWDLAGFVDGAANGTPDAQATGLFAAWMAAHPEAGYGELGRLALGDTNAMNFLSGWAAPQPRKVFGWIKAAVGEEPARALFAKMKISIALQPEQILSFLDVWSHNPQSQPDGWPVFLTRAGPSREYHALRLLAGRKPQSDEWVIVFERFEGYTQHLKVARYVYSDTLNPGRRADLDKKLWALLEQHGRGLEAQPDARELVEAPDYWTQHDGAGAAVGLARALLAEKRAVVFEPAAEVFKAVGLEGAEVIVDTTDFEHTEGPSRESVLPSESDTFSSLAAAIVQRKPKAFTRGEVNTGWAQHLGAGAQAAEEEEEDSEENDEEE